MRLTLREAFLGFRRAPVLSLLSITTIAFALFVVGLVALVGINLQRALNVVEERVEVVMYLRRGTPIEVATTAISDIESFPEVADVTYITEDQALEQARRELSEFRDVFGDLETNPLPASLAVRLKPGFRDARHVQVVAERLKGFRFAEDIRFGRDWVEKLDRLRNIGLVVSLLVGGAFAAASVIIIGTTIRISVLHRHREIAIMKLVGATDGFIRRPFLLEGAIKGAAGGALAVALCGAAYATVTQVYKLAFFDTNQAGLVILFGTTLGLLASAVSVGRQIRKL